MGGVASLRRIVVVSLLSIPVAAEVIFGEALFLGHVVLLVETLGFVWGLLAFIALWATLGVVVLAVSDFVWPWASPRLGPVLARLARRAADAKVALAALGASAALAGAAVTVALAGGEIRDWTADHSGDIATFFIVAAIVVPILLLIAQVGRRFENWVRGIAETASPVTRSFAALMSMAILGPALSWLLFRLLGYSDRATYVLTVAGAPVFAIWVPFYGLGVRAAIEGLF
jgi:hypothetical protein